MCEVGDLGVFGYGAQGAALSAVSVRLEAIPLSPGYSKKWAGDRPMRMLADCAATIQHAAQFVHSSFFLRFGPD